MNVVCNWKGQATTVVVVLAVMLAPASASADVVTLEQLEELALQNKAHWEAVEARSVQAGADVDAARAGKMPTFWMNISSVVAPGSDIERVQTIDGREVNVRASPTVGERTAFRPNIRYEVRSTCARRSTMAKPGPRSKRPKRIERPRKQVLAHPARPCSPWCARPTSTGRPTT